MTAHRRGGRPSGGGGRKKRQPQQRRRRRRSSSTSDEDSSEGSSITRCICGETHNLGLMVQCDKCEVWQHCRCMGLEQPDIPDQYYCEQCKPEHHKLTRLTNGRNKRHYSASGHATTTTTTTTTVTTTTTTQSNGTAVTNAPAPKKRMTLNSREASMSLEDVLAARSALEMYETNSTDNDKIHDSPPPLTKEEEIKSNKRKREMEIKLPETIDEKPEPPSSTVSSVGHDEIPPSMMIKSLEETSSPEPVNTTPSSPSVKSIKPKRKAKESPNKRVGRGGSSTNKRRGNGTRQQRSRTSTPQPNHDGSPAAGPSDEESTPNGDSLSTMLFEYFSPQARASSPPAKCRHPHARMSITEMNRRANQILEYISSIQVDMATNPSFIQQQQLQQQHAGHVINNNHIGEDDDDNDSLSSASTIPLIQHDEEEEEEEPVDREKQTSLEIMDMLTRKLIKFQRRFGSRHRIMYNEEMEGEGRMTRSREASSNNAYRNMLAH